MALCTQCGSALEAGAVFCGSCGATVAKPQPSVAADGACVGHPDRRAVGTCVRCGTFYCAECLPPRERGLLRCEACQALVSRLPWDERETIGLVRAWWQTCIKMISAPVQTLSTASPDASLGSSLLFAAISSLVGYFTTMAVYLLMIAGTIGFAASKDGGAGLGKIGVMEVGIILGTAAGTLLMTMGSSVLATLVWAGAEHLVLGFFGGNRGGYAVSVRAHALGMGVYLIGLVPICSLYVLPIWSIVIRIFGMQSLHRSTGGKAVGAVLIPVGVLLCCAVTGYGVMIASVIAAGK